MKITELKLHSNDKLILWLCRFYNSEKKTSNNEAMKIIKILASRGIITNKEQFINNWNI